MVEPVRARTVSTVGEGRKRGHEVTVRSAWLPTLRYEDGDSEGESDDGCSDEVETFGRNGL